MNGIIYIDPRTMKGSLYEESVGMEPYVPMSMVNEKEKTIDHAAEVVSMLANDNLERTFDAEKYRSLFIVALLVVAVLVLNFTLGGGVTWVNIATCIVWAVVNVVIVLHAETCKGKLRRMFDNEEEKAKIVAHFRKTIVKN